MSYFIFIRLGAKSIEVSEMPSFDSCIWDWAHKKEKNQQRNALRKTCSVPGSTDLAYCVQSIDVMGKTRKAVLLINES